MENEIWRVQLASGELRTMTLEALDAAYDEGWIQGQTPVLAPGASAWTTLAQAAGLEDEPSQLPSLSPVALDPAVRSSDVQRDLGLDTYEMDEDGLRPKKSRAALFVAVSAVAAVAAGLVFASTKLSGSAAGDVDMRAANALQAPPAATEIPAEPGSANAKPSLTEEQKKKLADADKAREEKTRSKQREKEPAPRRSPQKKSGSPFVNSGDKYDPLNGAL